jgi:prepilin-type N-terminal cleavage/methylation domain-containing protein
MKLSARHTVRHPLPRSLECTRAFTLPEMMIAVFLFSLIFMGTIGVWMFCLRWDQLVCSKLGSTEKARMSFDTLTADIRAAKWWRVGNGTNGASFVALGNAVNQVGNALKVSSSSDTNSTSYVIYYFNTNKCQLCRLPSGASTPTVMTSDLTNMGVAPYSMQFSAQKSDGTLAQDIQFKYAIVTTMEFCQYQYPLTRVGPNYYYNYYRIQLKAASHCPN